MMWRLGGLAVNVHQLQSVWGGYGLLAFGAGLSDPDEPDLWLRDFTGLNRLWVEIGQPEDKPLQKACGKSDEVILYCFHHAADVWWRGIESKLTRLGNLQVWCIPTVQAQSLAKLAERNMQLQATVQEGQLMLGNAGASVVI